MKFLFPLLLACAALLPAGCGHYRIGNPVPPGLRTLEVPVFENATLQPEVEALLTRAVRRECLRDGSLRPAPAGQAALRLEGRVTECSQEPVRYAAGVAETPVEYRVRLSATISVVETASGRVLLRPTTLAADTTYLVRGDLPTAKRDALRRATEELARRIVATVTAIW